MPPSLLLVPEKTDPETDAVLRAWENAGGEIRRLGKYWIPDAEIASRDLVLYGGQTFALILAQIYPIELVSPDDILISRLEQEWVRRSISLQTLGNIGTLRFPVFIKPVTPKSFTAGVYTDPNALLTATEGLDNAEPILVSTVIPDMQAEVRSFVLKGQICDMACYEGAADLESARIFLQQFLAAHLHLLPETLVIDLAWSPRSGWLILEFNACWGAGLNGCAAQKVLPCIAAATRRKL